MKFERIRLKAIEQAEKNRIVISNQDDLIKELGDQNKVYVGDFEQQKTKLLRFRVLVHY